MGIKVRKRKVQDNGGEAKIVRQYVALDGL